MDQSNLRVVLSAWARAKGTHISNIYIPDDKSFRLMEKGKKIVIPINLDFTNEMLALKETVECGKCKGAGHHPDDESIDGFECPPCEGTGKVERYVVDRGRYFDALDTILPKRVGTEKQHKDISLLDALIIEDNIAIHTATINQRIDAMAEALGG